jgi:8-oxo-dGTP pyrophosphatase MutT (NUDIX family)
MQGVLHTMSSFYQTKQDHLCSNCGLTGHTFRVCIEPVCSYGVLVFRWISREPRWPQATEFCKDAINPTGITGLIPQVLMIQRKDSLGFMDIMRGKYKVSEPDYIKKQLRGMTQGERHKLETMDFEEIWNELWGSDIELTTRYAHDHVISKQKLAELRSGVQLANGDKYCLADLLRQGPALYDTPEWGFPKGRRDPYESDIRCAFRELEEETSISEHEVLKVTNVAPFIEQFYGSNNIHYRHTYYIAHYIGNRNISFDALNSEMTREIGNLVWKNLDEAILLIRPENLEKRGILMQFGNLLRNYSPVIRSTLVATLDTLKQSPVNENATEEQQEYVFTTATGTATGTAAATGTTATNTSTTSGAVPGKVEKSRRHFGTRQIIRRISNVYSSSQGSSDQGTISAATGTGGNIISRYQ